MHDHRQQIAAGEATTSLSSETLASVQGSEAEEPTTSQTAPQVTSSLVIERRPDRAARAELLALVRRLAEAADRG